MCFDDSDRNDPRVAIEIFFRVSGETSPLITADPCTTLVVVTKRTNFVAPKREKASPFPVSIGFEYKTTS